VPLKPGPSVSLLFAPFRFAPFRLHGAQGLDSPVEVPFQSRLVTGKVGEGVSQNGFQLNVRCHLGVLTLRRLGIGHTLALHDGRPTGSTGAPNISGGNGPDHQPLAIPPAVDR